MIPREMIPLFYMWQHGGKHVLYMHGRLIQDSKWSAGIRSNSAVTNEIRKKKLCVMYKNVILQMYAKRCKNSRFKIYLVLKCKHKSRAVALW